MELNNKKTINDFVDKLRKVIPFYGFSSNAIQLLFLKFMADFTEVNDIFELRKINEYKNMFINKNFDYSLAHDVFEIAERKFEIQKGLLTQSLDILRKTFEKEEEFLFEVINEISLPSDKTQMKDLIKYLLDVSENKDISKTSSFITNASLLKLVSKILDVQKDDIYLDCFSGLFRSSLDVDAKNYLGFEVNYKVASIACMILILTGKETFAVKNIDFYTQNLHEVADKVFADGPIGINVTKEREQTIGYDTSKSEYYNIVGALNALKVNGMACVTCPQSVLYKNDFVGLRFTMTLRNLVAVITLPPLWPSSNQNLCLLVLTYYKDNDNVIMIDSSDKDYLLKEDMKSKTLSDLAIEQILEAIHGKEIDGFSKIMDARVIVDKETISLVPSKYIKQPEVREFRDIALIDKEVKEQYEEVQKLFIK